MSLKIDAAGRTDVGQQREHNEDAFSVIDAHGLYVVADGMGGHRAGNVASQMATETVRAFFDSTTREDATWPFHYDPALSPEENRLLTSIKVANKTIYEESARNPDCRGMGTTVVSALVNLDARRVFIGHVGDSRCYRIRDRGIVQLTQDHSLLNEYLRAMPDLPQAQRDELPRNVITRALGMTEVVLVDLRADGLRGGDTFVLCSDGLSGMLSDGEILATVLSHEGDPDAACEALVRLANDHGGEDNVTAVVLRVTDDTLAPPPDRAAASLEETRPMLSLAAVERAQTIAVPEAPTAHDAAPSPASEPERPRLGDDDDTVDAPSPFAPKE
ncbi:MAG: PP2C family serine/threonine-protein phosphatase [Polyangiales bacterium]